MGRILHRFLISLAVALAPFAACTSKGDGDKAPPSKTIEPGEAAGSFAQTRDRFLEQSRARLAELDAKIAGLKSDLASRSGELTAEAKRALTETIAGLEAKRAEAARTLEQAKGATLERWEQLKGKTDETLKSIDDAYQAAARELHR